MTYFIFTNSKLGDIIIMKVERRLTYMKISLRALRINAGFTLKEASKKLSISSETLRSYENKKTHPDFKKLSEILSLYNVKYGDIVYSDDYKDLIIARA